MNESESESCKLLRYVNVREILFSSYFTRYEHEYLLNASLRRKKVFLNDY